jgi:hypothetical protein
LILISPLMILAGQYGGHGGHFMLYWRMWFQFSSHTRNLPLLSKIKTNRISGRHTMPSTSPISNADHQHAMSADVTSLIRSSRLLYLRYVESLMALECSRLLSQVPLWAFSYDTDCARPRFDEQCAFIGASWFRS